MILNARLTCIYYKVWLHHLAFFTAFLKISGNLSTSYLIFQPT